MTFDDYISTGQLDIRVGRSRPELAKEIEAALRNAYDKSPIAKKMFDDWFKDENNQLDINFAAGKFEAGEFEINLDPAELENSLHVNSKGKVVKETLASALLHEIGHVMKGLDDPENPNTRDYADGDYAGANQTFINTILHELKMEDRISYQAVDPKGQFFTACMELSCGKEIDGAFFGTQIDLTKDTKSKSVVGAGATANDDIKMGSGDDFLVGQGGNDALDGGKGSDTAIYKGKASDYDIVLGEDGKWTVTHVRGLKEGDKGDGTDTLTNVEFLKFSDGVLDLDKFSKITLDDIYMALFGRAVDKAGLDFFRETTKNFQDLSGIGDLSATEEYQSRFEGKSNEDRIKTIYQDLFGRDPEASGLDFFLGLLNGGTQTINTIAMHILNGAQGTDKTIVENKVAAAKAFSAALDTQEKIDAYKGLEAAAFVRDAISKITDAVTSIPSPAEILQWVDSLISLKNGPQIESAFITLATDMYPVSPETDMSDLKTTSLNDTINAPAGTFTSNTNIDGGNGTDTLFVTTGEKATVSPTLNNLEKIFVMTGTAGFVANFENASGVEEVWNKDSAGLFFGSNLSPGVKLGIEGNVADTAFGFRAAEVNGANDSASIVLKNATSSGSVTLVDVETVNLTLDGNAVASLFAFPDAQTVNVLGTGTLSGVFSGPHSNFSAESLNGHVNLVFNGGTTGVRFTGGAGADIIAFESGAAALSDTIVYNTQNLSTAANRDVFSNFVGGGTEDKIDLSALPALEGAKTGIKVLGVAPGNGTSFDGYAVAVSGSSTVYVDTNNNGVLDLDSDLAFDVTGSAGSLVIGDFVFG